MSASFQETQLRNIKSNIDLIKKSINLFSILPLCSVNQNISSIEGGLYIMRDTNPIDMAITLWFNYNNFKINDNPLTRRFKNLSFREDDRYNLYTAIQLMSKYLPKDHLDMIFSNISSLMYDKMFSNQDNKLKGNAHYQMIYNLIAKDNVKILDIVNVKFKKIEFLDDIYALLRPNTLSFCRCNEFNGSVIVNDYDRKQYIHYFIKEAENQDMESSNYISINDKGQILSITTTDKNNKNYKLYKTNETKLTYGMMRKMEYILVNIVKRVPHNKSMIGSFDAIIKNRELGFLTNNNINKEKMTIEQKKLLNNYIYKSEVLFQLFDPLFVDIKPCKCLTISYDITYDYIRRDEIKLDYKDYKIKNRHITDNELIKMDVEELLNLEDENKTFNNQMRVNLLIKEIKKYPFYLYDNRVIVNLIHGNFDAKAFTEQDISEMIRTLLKNNSHFTLNSWYYSTSDERIKNIILSVMEENNNNKFCNKFLRSQGILTGEEITNTSCCLEIDDSINSINDILYELSLETHKYQCECIINMVKICAEKLNKSELSGDNSDMDSKYHCRYLIDKIRHEYFAKLYCEKNNISFLNTDQEVGKIFNNVDEKYSYLTPDIINYNEYDNTYTIIEFTVSVAATKALYRKQIAYKDLINHLINLGYNVNYEPVVFNLINKDNNVNLDLSNEHYDNWLEINKYCNKFLTNVNFQDLLKLKNIKRINDIESKIKLSVRTSKNKPLVNKKDDTIISYSIYEDIKNKITKKSIKLINDMKDLKEDYVSFYLENDELMTRGHFNNDLNSFNKSMLLKINQNVEFDNEQIELILENIIENTSRNEMDRFNAFNTKLPLPNKIFNIKEYETTTIDKFTKLYLKKGQIKHTYSSFIKEHDPKQDKYRPNNIPEYSNIKFNYEEQLNNDTKFMDSIVFNLDKIKDDIHNNGDGKFYTAQNHNIDNIDIDVIVEDCIDRTKSKKNIELFMFPVYIEDHCDKILDDYVERNYLNKLTKIHDQAVLYDVEFKNYEKNCHISQSNLISKIKTLDKSQSDLRILRLDCNRLIQSMIKHKSDDYDKYYTKFINSENKNKSLMKSLLRNNDLIVELKSEINSHVKNMLMKNNYVRTNKNIKEGQYSHFKILDLYKDNENNSAKLKINGKDKLVGLSEKLKMDMESQFAEHSGRKQLADMTYLVDDDETMRNIYESINKLQDQFFEKQVFNEKNELFENIQQYLSDQGSDSIYHTKLKEFNRKEFLDFLNFIDGTYYAKSLNTLFLLGSYITDNCGRSHANKHTVVSKITKDLWIIIRGGKNVKGNKGKTRPYKLISINEEKINLKLKLDVNSTKYCGEIKEHPWRILDFEYCQYMMNMPFNSLLFCFNFYQRYGKDFIKRPLHNIIFPFNAKRNNESSLHNFKQLVNHCCSHTSNISYAISTTIPTKIDMIGLFIIQSYKNNFINFYKNINFYSNPKSITGKDTIKKLQDFISIFDSNRKFVKIEELWQIVITNWLMPKAIISPDVENMINLRSILEDQVDLMNSYNDINYPNKKWNDYLSCNEKTNYDVDEIIQDKAVGKNNNFDKNRSLMIGKILKDFINTTGQSKKLIRNILMSLIIDYNDVINTHGGRFYVNWEEKYNDFHNSDKSKKYFDPYVEGLEIVECNHNKDDENCHCMRFDVFVTYGVFKYKSAIKKLKNYKKEDYAKLINDPDDLSCIPENLSKCNDSQRIVFKELIIKYNLSKYNNCFNDILKFTDFKIDVENDADINYIVQLKKMMNDETLNKLMIENIDNLKNEDYRNYKKNLNNISDHLSNILSEAIGKNGMYFHMTYKVQRGGSREIYVPCINTALKIKFCENIFHHISCLIPNEFTTMPSDVRDDKIHRTLVDTEYHKMQNRVISRDTIDNTRWGPGSNVTKYIYMINGFRGMLPDNIINNIEKILYDTQEHKYLIMPKSSIPLFIMNDNEYFKKYRNHFTIINGRMIIKQNFSWIMGMFNKMSSLFHAGTQMYFYLLVNRCIQSRISKLLNDFSSERNKKDFVNKEVINYLNKEDKDLNKIKMLSIMNGENNHDKNNNVNKLINYYDGKDTDFNEFGLKQELFPVIMEASAHSDDAQKMQAVLYYIRNDIGTIPYEVFQFSMNHICSHKKCTVSERFIEFLSIYYIGDTKLPNFLKFLQIPILKPTSGGYQSDINSIYSTQNSLITNGANLSLSYITSIINSIYIRECYKLNYNEGIYDMPIECFGVPDTYPDQNLLLGSLSNNIRLLYYKFDNLMTGIILNKELFMGDRDELIYKPSYESRGIILRHNEVDKINEELNKIYDDNFKFMVDLIEKSELLKIYSPDKLFKLFNIYMQINDRSLSEALAGKNWKMHFHQITLGLVTRSIKTNVGMNININDYNRFFKDCLSLTKFLIGDNKLYKRVILNDNKQNIIELKFSNESNQLTDDYTEISRLMTIPTLLENVEYPEWFKDMLYNIEYDLDAYYDIKDKLHEKMKTINPNIERTMYEFTNNVKYKDLELIPKMHKHNVKPVIVSINDRFSIQTDVNHIRLFLDLQSQNINNDFCKGVLPGMFEHYTNSLTTIRYISKENDWSTRMSCTLLKRVRNKPLFINMTCRDRHVYKLSDYYMLIDNNIHNDYKTTISRDFTFDKEADGRLVHNVNKNIGHYIMNIITFMSEIKGYDIDLNFKMNNSNTKTNNEFNNILLGCLLDLKNGEFVLRKADNIDKIKLRDIIETQDINPQSIEYNLIRNILNNSPTHHYIVWAREQKKVGWFEGEGEFHYMNGNFKTKVICHNRKIKKINIFNDPEDINTFNQIMLLCDHMFVNMGLNDFRNSAIYSRSNDDRYGFGYVNEDAMLTKSPSIKPVSKLEFVVNEVNFVNNTKIISPVLNKINIIDLYNTEEYKDKTGKFVSINTEYRKYKMNRCFEISDVNNKNDEDFNNKVKNYNKSMLGISQFNDDWFFNAIETNYRTPTLAFLVMFKEDNKTTFTSNMFNQFIKKVKEAEDLNRRSKPIFLDLLCNINFNIMDLFPQLFILSSDKNNRIEICNELSKVNKDNAEYTISNIINKYSKKDIYQALCSIDLMISKCSTELMNENFPPRYIINYFLSNDTTKLIQDRLEKGFDSIKDVSKMSVYFQLNKVNDFINSINLPLIKHSPCECYKYDIPKDISQTCGMLMFNLFSNKCTKIDSKLDTMLYNINSELKGNKSDDLFKYGINNLGYTIMISILHHKLNKIDSIIKMDETGNEKHNNILNIYNKNFHKNIIPNNNLNDYLLKVLKSKKVNHDWSLCYKYNYQIRKVIDNNNLPLIIINNFEAKKMIKEIYLNNKDNLKNKNTDAAFLNYYQGLSEVDKIKLLNKSKPDIKFLMINSPRYVKPIQLEKNGIYKRNIYNNKFMDKYADSVVPIDNIESFFAIINRYFKDDMMESIGECFEYDQPLLSNNFISPVNRFFSYNDEENELSDFLIDFFSNDDFEGYVLSIRDYIIELSKKYIGNYDDIRTVGDENSFYYFLFFKMIESDKFYNEIKEEIDTILPNEYKFILNKLIDNHLNANSNEYILSERTFILHNYDLITINVCKTLGLKYRIRENKIGDFRFFKDGKFMDDKFTIYNKFEIPHGMDDIFDDNDLNDKVDDFIEQMLNTNDKEKVYVELNENEKLNENINIKLKDRNSANFHTNNMLLKDVDLNEVLRTLNNEKIGKTKTLNDFDLDYITTSRQYNEIIESIGLNNFCNYINGKFYLNEHEFIKLKDVKDDIVVLIDKLHDVLKNDNYDLKSKINLEYEEFIRDDNSKTMKKIIRNFIYNDGKSLLKDKMHRLLATLNSLSNLINFMLSNYELSDDTNHSFNLINNCVKFKANSNNWYKSLISNLSDISNKPNTPIKIEYNFNIDDHD